MEIQKEAFKMLVKQNKRRKEIEKMFVQTDHSPMSFSPKLDLVLIQ